MANLDSWLLVVTVAGMAVGGWSILSVQTGAPGARLVLGHTLFVAALLLIGSSSVVAALHHADGLVLLGLAAGMLVVGMLWETNPPAWRGADAESSAEQM